jgi:hypothetical protein
MNMPRPAGLGLHGRQESNLQPSVLETDALPVELRPYEVLWELGPEMPEAARTRTGPRRLHEKEVPNSGAALDGLIGVPAKQAGPQGLARLHDVRRLDGLA